jgi:acetyl esterase/lipase
MSVVLTGAGVLSGPALADAPIVYHDVPYRVVDGVTLRMDIYVPHGPGPYPAVLVVHGGAWKAGDKTEFAGEGDGLASAGFVAFVANYRLAPPGGAWHAPTPVRDLRAAVRWIRSHASDYAADPGKVGALGGSAGGNLAQMLGVTGRAGEGRVDAVVSWSGSTELRLCVLGSKPDQTCPNRANYVGADMEVDPEAWDAASPYYSVDGADAPMYLANSTDEMVALEEATDMAAALEAFGVPVELRVIQGDAHARGYEDLVWDESVAFLRQYVSPGL